MYNGLVEIAEKYKGLTIYNSCANFVFVKTPEGKAIWEYLKSNSIVIRYMGDYIRISAGTEQEVVETLCCIEKYFVR